MIPLLLTSLVLSATCLITTVSDVRVVHFINGNLGDNSFFDSVASGLDRAEKDLGVKMKTFQASYNKTNWSSALEAAASMEDYDIPVA